MPLLKPHPPLRDPLQIIAAMIEAVKNDRVGHS